MAKKYKNTSKRFSSFLLNDVPSSLFRSWTTPKQSNKYKPNFNVMKQVISLSFYPISFVEEYWLHSCCYFFTLKWQVKYKDVSRCIPLEWSRSGSVIYDYSDHGTSNKPMNPFSGWICQFLPCADVNNLKKWQLLNTTALFKIEYRCVTHDFPFGE